MQSIEHSLKMNNFFRIINPNVGETCSLLDSINQTERNLCSLTGKWRENEPFLQRHKGEMLVEDVRGNRMNRLWYGFEFRTGINELIGNLGIG